MIKNNYTNPIVTAKLNQFGLLLCVAVLLAGLTGCAGNRYDRSTGEYIDDKAIIERVEDRLEDDAIYKFNEVNVSSFKGTVQLSGFVRSSEQKSRAEELAEEVNGVKEVVNNITVRE